MGMKQTETFAVAMVSKEPLRISRINVLMIQRIMKNGMKRIVLKLPGAESLTLEIYGTFITAKCGERASSRSRFRSPHTITGHLSGPNLEIHSR